MDLVGGKAVQRFRDRFVGEGSDFGQGLTLDHLRSHGAGGNGAAAAAGFELDIFNDIILDFQVHLHDVPAFCATDFTDSVGILKNADNQ